MRPRPQEPLLLRQPGSVDGVLVSEQDLEFIPEMRTHVNKKATYPVFIAYLVTLERICNFHIDNCLHY